MGRIKIYIALMTIGLVLISSAFAEKKHSATDYGFLYSTIINDSLYHYAVVDIEMLGKLKASYYCNIGGRFCSVKVNIDTIRVLRKGCYNEIIEFDSSPASVKQNGKGGSFIFEIN